MKEEYNPIALLMTITCISLFVVVVLSKPEILNSFVITGPNLNSHIK